MNIFIISVVSIVIVVFKILCRLPDAVPLPFLSITVVFKAHVVLMIVLFSKDIVVYQARI